MRRIGVIGGGQLGRMFALDAKRMGFHVIVLDPQEHSPCGQVADEQILAKYDDAAAIEELGKKTDVVTFEFENIAIGSVEYLERRGYTVHPSSKVLKITQDRLLEKQFVRDCGISVPDFAPVERLDDFAKATMRIGLPAIMKTARGGYDGKGQWRITEADDVKLAFAEAKGARLIYESLIGFTKELSVVATRNQHDEVVTYPPSENIHDHGILSMSIAPARVPKAVAKQAQEMAATIGRKLGIIGTYCVEFFLNGQTMLMVNEIAPRPHNSGHYTMDATPCSQYEQHIRAICDLPLSPPKLLSNAIMCNILGTGTGDDLLGIEQLLADPSIVLHLYGKHHAVDRRKMGHFTMLIDGPITDIHINRALAARATLSWGSIKA